MGVINGEFRLWLTLLMAGSVSNIDQEHEGQDVYCFSLSLSLSLSRFLFLRVRTYMYGGVMQGRGLKMIPGIILRSS